MMNLALQKRHEQLERWRQNEANEQQQQQQQQQATESKQPNEDNQNSSINKSDEQTKSVYSGFKSVRNNISPQPDQTTKSSSSQPRLRLTTSVGGAPRLSSAGGQQQQVAGDASGGKHQVKFSNSTLFLSACANGDLDECKRLLDAKLVDINVTTCDGLTGLHEAAICNDAQLVEFLLARGANINCCDHEGWTPLHAAASLGQTNIVELLLKNQAEATIVNCENFLALDLARNDEVRELIERHLEGRDMDQLRRQEELMIERDIDKWIRTGQYEEKFHPVTQASVLHVVAAKGYTKLLKRILETPSLKKQIDLEARDSEGFTPLLAGSFWNQTDIVELLIEHGANIFAQSNSGYKISSFVSVLPSTDRFCLFLLFSPQLESWKRVANFDCSTGTYNNGDSFELRPGQRSHRERRSIGRWRRRQLPRAPVDHLSSHHLFSEPRNKLATN